MVFIPVTNPTEAPSRPFDAVVGVDTTLHCLHAAMAQSPIWYCGLRGAPFDRAVDRLVDTLMKLVAEQAPTQ